MSAAAKQYLAGLVTLMVMGVAAGMTLIGVLPTREVATYAVIGATTAAVMNLLTRARGFGWAPAALCSFVAFIGVGAVTTRGLPSPDNIMGFLGALTSSWSTLLTTIPPVDATPDTIVLPLALAWFAVALGSELFTRSVMSAAAACGPLAAAAVGLGFSRAHSIRSVAVGAVLIVGMLCLVGLARPAFFGLQRGVAILIVAALGVIGTASSFSPDPTERFDLRELHDRSWDPLQEPSPLSELKGWLKDHRRDDVVFTVLSGQSVDRFTIATLAHYDGHLWTITDPDAAERTLMWPVGSQLPPTVGSPAATAANTVEHEIEISALGGHWLPVAGSPTGITGSIDARFDPNSGTLASPDALTPGTTYQVTSILRPSLSIEQLSTAAPGRFEVPRVELPTQLTNAMTELTFGLPELGPALEAVVSELRNRGFYDTDPLSLSSRPGHTFNRLLTFLDEEPAMAGYEEQFAASAAVMAEGIGFDARVVVGFVVPRGAGTNPPIAVKAQNISAWIEINTVDGWRSVDVTPPRTRERTDEDTDEQVDQSTDEQRTRNSFASSEPPDLDDETDEPQADVDLLDRDPEVTPPEPPEETTVDSPVLLVAIRVVGILLAIVAWPLIVAYLWRRRTRSRVATALPQEQIHGAWAELRDRLDRSGHVWPGAHSSEEISERLASTDSLAPARLPLQELAQIVDRAALHPEPPSDDDSKEAWLLLDEATKSFVDNRGRRLRWLIRPPGLMPDRPKPARGVRREGSADIVPDAASGDVIDLRLDAFGDDGSFENADAVDDRQLVSVGGGDVSN